MGNEIEQIVPEPKARSSQRPIEKGKMKMSKKVMMIVCLFCLSLFLPSAHAEDFVIKDYLFTWHIAKVGEVTMDIQKSPEGTAVVLRSLGGPLATLLIPPSQAKEIGELLNKTEDYYSEQKKSEDMKSSKTVFTGNYRVTFSSKQGSSFVASIAEFKVLGAAVLLGKDPAVEIGTYLRKAPEMAALVNDRIKP